MDYMNYVIPHNDTRRLVLVECHAFFVKKSRVRFGHGFFFGQFEGRIQAVSGQFGCPDFLYHEGRKKGGAV